jgi:hypothetical protein
MLAVRSGRYDDVERMIDLSLMDFKLAGWPSAWEYTLLINDPTMIQIMETGRLRQ